MNDRTATTDHPINQLLAARWSPYGFQDKAVPAADLCALFEAARWSASSYNEQPWRFFIAQKEQPAQFKRLLSCLVEGNQKWAQAAPVLVLAAVNLKFAGRDADNPAALHDLGLATANMAIEATARGLCIHPMIGILADQARQLYQIPQEAVACTAIAIGYPEDPEKMPDNLKKRDLSPRHRKPLSEFLFAEKWGNTATLQKNL